jgi:hypothetical protein
VPQGAIRPQIDKGGHVTGGGDADRPDTDEFTDVASRFLGVVDKNARDLEAGIAGQQADDL